LKTNFLALALLGLIFSGVEAVAMDFALRPYGGDAPASNSIGDIAYDASNGVLWVGTASNGVSVSTDGGRSWTDYLQGAGTSAIASWSGITIVALAHDTTIGNESYPRGDGFALTRDNGRSWASSTPENANKIGRLAYDLVIVPEARETTIWAPCFYGGLLKSTDWMQSWVNVFMDTMDSALNFQSLSHRFFSFAFDSTTNPPTLYAGTAAGIYRSTDGGRVWQQFKYTPGLTGGLGITGNWIVALAVQYLPGNNILWASTRKALGETEYDGVSYLLQGDSIFHHIPDTITVWNFAFVDSVVLFATTEGLFYSYDRGNTLNRIDIFDHISGVRLGNPEVISVLYDGRRLWAGTNEGLAYSDELCGTNWRILGTFPPPYENETYAAPSPFSPLKQFTNIIFRDTGQITPVVEIYDYSLILVRKLDANISQNGLFRVQWDGKNEQGDFVANGIYFYRVRSGRRTLWGKVVVIK